MTDFDPEKFEDKYANYFPQLQRAYKSAFETMNEEYDSTLVHAIDQQILSESEPFYDDGEFHIQLPQNPVERVDVQGAVFEPERIEATLDRYVEELESELYRIFGVDPEN